jgi:hypothetical protein
MCVEHSISVDESNIVPAMRNPQRTTAALGSLQISLKVAPELAVEVSMLRPPAENSVSLMDEKVAHLPGIAPTHMPWYSLHIPSSGKHSQTLFKMSTYVSLLSGNVVRTYSHIYGKGYHIFIHMLPAEPYQGPLNCCMHPQDSCRYTKVYVKYREGDGTCSDMRVPKHVLFLQEGITRQVARNLKHVCQCVVSLVIHMLTDRLFVVAASPGSSRTLMRQMRNNWPQMAHSVNSTTNRPVTFPCHGECLYVPHVPLGAATIVCTDPHEVRMCDTKHWAVPLHIRTCQHMGASA